MTLASIILLAVMTPTVWFGLVLTALLTLAYALDSADGQLARLRGGGSPAGEWLDHVFDCVKASTLHMAVLISWYRHFDRPELQLLIPVAFGVQASVWFFAMILGEKLRPSKLPAARSHLWTSGPSTGRAVASDAAQ